MKRNIFLMTAMLVVTLFAFGGCGGGDDDPKPDGDVLAGRFIDAPVENFGYICSPSGLSGVTDEKGFFSYKYEDNISFFFGSGEDKTRFLYLKPILADTIITPMDYYPEESDDPEIGDKTVNLIRLILSGASVYNDLAVILDDNPYNSYTGEFSETKFAQMEDANAITVPPEDAREHFRRAVLKEYAGAYNGTWKGTNNKWSGAFELTISDEGSITGTFTQIGSTGQGTLSGTVNPNGATTIDATGSAGRATWTANIDIKTGAIFGNWSNSYNNNTGTFTGQRGATPPIDEPVVDTKLNGTWKATDVAVSLNGEAFQTFNIVSSIPETFIVRMIVNNNKYTMNVNNNGQVVCYDSAGNDWSISSVTNMIKMGTEKYEAESISGSGTLKTTIELTGTNKAVYTEEWQSNAGSYGTAKITYTRVETGPVEPVTSALNGTWKITQVYRTYWNEIIGHGKTVIPTELLPTQFLVKILANGNNYTVNVNNEGEAKWVYAYGGPPQNAGGGFFGYFKTISGFKKTGTEKYLFVEGEEKATVELISENKGLVTIDSRNTVYGMTKTEVTLTRVAIAQ